MANEVLVDSNVYIRLLKHGKDSVATLFDWSEAEGRNLAVCGMVRLEVLRGVKVSRFYQAISSLMDVMVNVRSDNRLWDEATHLAWKLDRKGFVIPGPDAVIAASALRLGAAIMTSDAHFSKVDGLRVIAPPAEWFT
ncbi:MAG: PIN domain-containing protein [Luteolibacter sp.]|uniref:type II toxin-antitoxin system VapC family toxin n=1 Tax=Luteolibacter sp. TaxID=1962973 RepID=UPI00326425B9